jgi:hypothetical protein
VKAELLALQIARLENRRVDDIQQKNRHGGVKSYGAGQEGAVPASYANGISPDILRRFTYGDRCMAPTSPLVSDI